MSIKTTLYMHDRIMKKLESASKQLRMPKSHIVRLVLARVQNDRNDLSKFWTRVSYQKKEKDSHWVSFHLALQESEYELCLDLRKVYKMSVSFIVAFAIDKYLIKIIAKFVKAKDVEGMYNSFINSYRICGGDVDGVQYWLISWGISPKPVFLINANNQNYSMTG